jgi:hypothetical protein
LYSRILVALDNSLFLKTYSCKISSIAGQDTTLYLLIRHKNIINYIKAQILSWFGHLHRMPEERTVKRVYKWKPMLTRPLGRPTNRWEDDIRNDMQKLKIKDWTSYI